MSHLKRKSSPKTWPIPRKGSKYLTSPYPGKILELSLPLNLAVRDLLKLANIRREVRIMLHNKEVLLNGKPADSTKSLIGLFDVLSLPKIKKNYRLTIDEHRKLTLEEVSDAEAKSKVCKVIGKTTLKGNKTQINFLNGNNVLSDSKVKTNDSMVVDLQKGTASKHLPFKEGAKALVIGGSHLGKQGTIEKIMEKESVLKIGKESFNIQPKNLYIIG